MHISTSGFLILLYSANNPWIMEKKYKHYDKSN